MTHDIKELKLPLQKVIELGAIDRWLRGVAKIVPKAADPGHRFSAERDIHSFAFDISHPSFNTHTLGINRSSLVTTEDIERMVGFRQVLNAASHNNVRLDLTTVEGQSLSVAFEPDEVFSRSQVFGKSYSNVLPAIFGRKTGITA